jgi:hypothetical protein
VIFCCKKKNTCIQRVNYSFSLYVWQFIAQKTGMKHFDADLKSLRKIDGVKTLENDSDNPIIS